MKLVKSHKPKFKSLEAKNVYEVIDEMWCHCVVCPPEGARFVSTVRAHSVDILREIVQDFYNTKRDICNKILLSNW